MNNTSKTIVSAVFKSEKQLSEAIKYLEDKGVAKEDINILVSGKNSYKDFKINTSNKVSEFAIRGVSSGSIIGAMFGSVAFVGVLIIPAMGIAVAGPVIGALTGIATGAVVGTLVGAVVGYYIPEYKAVFFDENINENTLLITKIDKSFKNETKKKFIGIGAVNIAAQ